MGRLVLYVGALLIGMLLLLQQPTPLAIAPNDEATSDKPS